MKFKKENYYTRHDENTIQTCSLEDLKNAVDYMVNTVIKNNKCPCEVPVYFTKNGKTYEFTDFSMGLGFGKETRVQIEFDDYYEIKFVAPDSKPEHGEYWTSRGIGTGLNGVSDCSGFVVSQDAGARLRRLVRYVLDKDEIESWLDYRENEPDWIQFKFSGNEFDLEKLNELVKNNNDVVTLEILKECKL